MRVPRLLLTLASRVETGSRHAPDLNDSCHTIRPVAGRRDGAAHSLDLQKCQRAAVLQTSDLFAQQLVIDAYAGYYRLQPPFLLVLDIGLAALQTGLAASQEMVAPLTQRRSRDAILAGRGLQIRAAEQFQDDRNPGRAERAAVIVTTNLPFSEWNTMFPNARLCKAMSDRLTDQAHIIDTGKESYRFRRTLEKKKGGRG